MKSVAIALIALEGIKNKGSNEIVWREDIYKEHCFGSESNLV